jgi:hypothetical protein
MPSGTYRGGQPDVPEYDARPNLYSTSVWSLNAMYFCLARICINLSKPLGLADSLLKRHRRCTSLPYSADPSLLLATMVWVSMPM